MKPDSEPQAAAAPRLDLLPTNARFLAFWLSKLQAGRVPAKAAIDPTEMPRLLPDLVLYERLDRSCFRVRLAGTAVVRRLGVDPTGGNVLDLLHEGSRGPVACALNRIIEEPCGHVSRVRDRYPSGRQAVVEVLRLPMADEDGAVRFIISSTAETSDEAGWSDPQEKPVLLAELLDQAFFTWRPSEGGAVVTILQEQPA